MEILINDRRKDRAQVVLLFGVGMIGSAIRDALERLQFKAAHRISVDWVDDGRRARTVEAIGRTCQSLVPTPSRLSIAWSAGRSNFFSSAEDIERESRSFEEVLQLAGDLKQSVHQVEVDFHFLSSAGGLFESQRIVSSDSVPAPQRPYGEMKYAQENQLRTRLDSHEFTIYRPSSVYGPMVETKKHGLINHLIANASNRRTSVLDANVMALRDYVYAGDIGEYVARRISFAGRGTVREPVNFLVSARCASIFEVVTRIEQIMKLKVRHRFDENFGNSANITFSDSVLPADWHPSTLEVGMRQFMLRDRPQTRAISALAGIHH